MRPAAGGPEDAVLVRDGFHILAFLLPAVWMLFHRLWLETLAFLAVALALGWLGSLDGFGSGASLLSLLVALYAGLEGASIRLAALRRRGWSEWGVVEADGRADAEIRYLTEAVAVPGSPDSSKNPVHQARPGQPPRIPAKQGPALGLFAYPGRD
jgi:hypothetical protein